MKKKHPIWLPPHYKHGADCPKGHISNVDGESTWIYLRHFENDQTLHGRVWNSCCDCGLEHLNTFNVVRTRNGSWWLVKRSYRDYKTGKNNGKDIKRKE